MAFTQITVTASYETAENDPAAGTVEFLPTAPMVNAGTTVIAAPVAAVLGVGGGISLALAANNDAGTTPPGVGYRVSEFIDGQTARRYTVVIPATAPSGTVDLATLPHSED